MQKTIATEVSSYDAEALNVRTITTWLDGLEADAPDVARTVAILQECIRQNKGLVHSFFTQKVRSAPPYARDVGLTLHVLEKEPYTLRLRDLFAAGAIARLDDLIALGITSFARLLDQDNMTIADMKRYAGAAWSDFLHALTQHGDWWSATVWIQHRQRLSADDLCALNVKLSKWLERDPTLFDHAAPAHEWLSKSTAKDWKKKAGLHSSDYNKWMQHANVSFRAPTTSTKRLPML